MIWLGSLRVVPYSDIVAFGKESSSEQNPPYAEKVEHVLQVFLALHFVSTCAQNPSRDSALQARYCWQVAKGIWVVLANSYVPVADPPWQEPAISAPQFRMYWIDKLISGPPTPAFIRWILMRSPNAERAPCAQQEPQYCGMCWLRLCVTHEVPFIFDQSQLSGIASTSTYVCGRGSL